MESVQDTVNLQKVNDKKNFTKDEFLKFYDACMLRDDCYTKTYKLSGEGKEMSVTLRTKWDFEADMIFAKLKDVKDNSVAIAKLMSDCNIAFSLVKINDIVYDIKGEGLEERLSRLSKMPVIKKILIWDLSSKFDEMVAAMKDSIENF